MKLSNVILSAMVLVGSSAFANTSATPAGNSTCPHMNKTDSWTKTASLNAVDTVFGSTSNPAKKTVPQEKATVLK